MQPKNTTHFLTNHCFLFLFVPGKPAMKTTFPCLFPILPYTGLQCTAVYRLNCMGWELSL